MKKVCLTLAAALLASLAHANPVTIDPDGLTEGTDITNAFSGVTLHHITVVKNGSSGVLVVDNVYAKECPTTSDPTSRCSALGSGAFGFQKPTGVIAAGFFAESTTNINCVTNNPNACRLNPPDMLDVTFDSAVQQVSIDATHQSDWPHAWALDASGNLLQVELEITWHQEYGPSHPQNNFGYQTLTVTPVSGQISRVIFAGLGGFSQFGKITYEP